MNTSLPVVSQLEGVSFECLTSRDVRALSARRITSSTTYDTLRNPVQGGLYTSELGAFAERECTTCGLRNPQCPGHPGHIELPAPCYHPTFMDQILRLLRASCIYCGRLKLARALVARFVARLRLVRYGLLKELDELPSPDDMQKKEGEDESGSEEDDVNIYDRYVNKAIRRAQKDGSLSTQKTEATNNARRRIIQDFMSSITKGKKCHNCMGINHLYRKDRLVKIFRKALSEKEHVEMVQKGMKAKDPVIELRRRMHAEKSRKRKRDADEGMIDMDQMSNEDADNVDTDDTSEGEPEIIDGTMLDEATESKTSSKSRKAPAAEEYMNPSRVHAQLTQLFERDGEVLSLIYGADRRSTGDKVTHVSADMFFMRDILVPPNRYRPETKAQDVNEAAENKLYISILNSCESMAAIERELKNKEQPAESRYRARTYIDFENAWIALQEGVNSLIDRNLAPVSGRAAINQPEGVKQKLEKKEGMFRKYMMGKRVNFAARTVLSPDPNIETNEIGVPPVFARKLTYPEPVTQWNIEEMQEAVKNGPHIWPGAAAIENENGSIINLDRKSPDERTSLAHSLLAPPTTGHSKGSKPKKVHRHLNNGDIVIMNRQPTLHKPSMMCHRARVLPGEKTLRMHYANCNTYNADFDGDEMNMHFPQNELARAEALSIADTDHQYLSGTAGNPLRGLIQDHISICVWLTNRDMFFERHDYMNLLYSALRPENGHCTSGRLEILPPAIMKPTALWTGKQVVSSVLKNLTPLGAEGLTMTGKSKTDGKLWGEEGKEENIVVFQQGEHLQGILDKQQIGPTSGGFINAVYETYGHTTAGKLLSVLGRLLTKLLHMRAFSCGVEDLIFTKKGEEDRRQALAGAETVGLEVAAKYVSLQDQNPKSDDRELRRRLEDVLRDDTKQQGLDQLMNNGTKNLSTAVGNACMPAGLTKPFPRNQMQTMTNSGAKGSNVNSSLISCNLGQQVLEGRRVPVMVSGKTLPCFKPFESSVRAGGYIVDRFLTGIRPQEYFFHAMAGREGLIDTAVKTSRSGYLQRCLIKGMEGLRVEYDSSVRDLADGSVIQFLYGEDGLDVGKAKYLPDFKFAIDNSVSLFQSFNLQDEFAKNLSEDAREHVKAAEKKYRRTGDLGASDVTLSIYPPAQKLGSISEKLYTEAKKYADENPDRKLRDKKRNIEGPATLSKRNFNALLDMRYMKSTVEAGEAVGVVAGQSVGEPSTQMTLNTFHLAGHAAKNVTLGIPRLREIVMTAAPNIATPTMTLRLTEGMSSEDARKFAKGISKLSLAEIVDKVRVNEKVGPGVAYAEAKMYQVKLDFFPSEEYMKEHAVTIADVIGTIEWKLLPRLQASIRKELKKQGVSKLMKGGTGKSDALPEIGKSAGTIEQESSRPEGMHEGGDDDSDGDGDDDATRDKSKSNKQQAGYDAYEDDEENAIAKQNQKRDESEDASDAEGEGETHVEGCRPDSLEPEDEEHKAQTSLAKNRETRIKSNNKTNDITAFSFNDATGATCAFTFEYDSATPKLLFINLLEAALHSALIQSIPGLTTCMLDEAAAKESGSGVPHIATSGVNIPAMWEQQHVVNPDYIYTNSVHHILLHYGVEAARGAIVRELQGVFGGHGISVDPRHLTLIADYMTRDGAYQAFSRMGYRGSASPFMKMSFETTVGFLRDAVLEGEGDDLRGPSARIVAGRLGKMGTGGFDVLLPVRPGGEDDEDTVMGGIAAVQEEERDEDVEMEG